MKIKALVGATALAALVASGAVAYAQDAGGQAPGTMAPIPNPPETPKAHHGGKHHHAMKHGKKHHKAAAPAAAPAK